MDSSFRYILTCVGARKGVLACVLLGILGKWWSNLKSFLYLYIICSYCYSASGLFSHIGLAVIPVIDLSTHREIGTLYADKIQRLTNKINTDIPEQEFSNFSMVKEDMR